MKKHPSSIHQKDEGLSAITGVPVCCRTAWRQQSSAQPDMKHCCSTLNGTAGSRLDRSCSKRAADAISSSHRWSESPTSSGLQRVPLLRVLTLFSHPLKTTAPRRDGWSEARICSQETGRPKKKPNPITSPERRFRFLPRRLCQLLNICWV